MTADRHGFFKYMASALAEKHGMRATFMPKPFINLSGNGCHVHHSLWRGDEEVFLNRFRVGSTGEDVRGLDLSAEAYHWLGGLLDHAPAMCALTNPTVNSYKRINAPVTASGATWSPNTVSYTDNNRTHMVRVPGPGRFELRLPDGAANPYLLQAAIIAAGLSGLKTNADPGKRHDIDMYAEGHTVKDAPKLPLNLLDAIRALDADETFKDALGPEFAASYIKMKHQEWDSFVSHFSAWEREHTLDI